MSRIAKEKICGIYKITSPSNRIYIGQSIDIERRKNTYRRVETCIKRQIKIYNSLMKYGWEAHIFEIIEECSFDKLNVRERYWQEFYNSTNENNLNICLASTQDKKLIHSEETINKISSWHIEFHKTNNNRMFGKKHSEETKQIISKKAKDRYKKELNPNCKKCYCVETGIEWNSIKECWEELFKDKYVYSYFQNMLGGYYRNRTTIRKKSI